jgi:hypothetical protein
MADGTQQESSTAGIDDGTHTTAGIVFNGGVSELLEHLVPDGHGESASRMRFEGEEAGGGGDEID